MVLTPGLQHKIPESFIGVDGIFPVIERERKNINNAIRQQISKDGFFAIVGGCLQAFATVQHILKAGISPSRIIMIDPLDSADSVLFSETNDELENALYRQMKEIKIYRGYTIIGIESQTSEGIESLIKVTVAFGNQNENIDIAVLLDSNRKFVDDDFFTAVNDSNIVYDGGLVIDNYFRTNDSSM